MLLYFDSSMWGVPNRARNLPLPLPMAESGDKLFASEVLLDKGLSFLFQDRLHVQTPDGYEISEPGSLFHPHEGVGRYNTKSPDRRSYETVEGKRCLKIRHYKQSPPYRNWDCYDSWFSLQGYREFGLSVDVHFPSGLDLRNAAGGMPNGKTHFLIGCGDAGWENPGSTGGQPGFQNSGQGKGRGAEISYVEDQRACPCGLNWNQSKGVGTLNLRWYQHAVGKKRILRGHPGSVPPAGAKYSYTENNFAVPVGRWFTLTLYGRVDTDRTDGLLEVWITDPASNGGKPFAPADGRITGLDLGGWQGDRGIRGGIQTSGGSLKGTAGGGWRWRFLKGRDMIGGVPFSFTNPPNPFYYAYNWRIYGKE
ncbi:MAG: hypothetical protein V2I43_05205 [Parvularcula sp.]|jgi:hypothetical protein|nr:hypothetical protein [Parvularcula sp.]